MNAADTRTAVRTTSVQVVYRHIRSDAMLAASLNDWAEHRRLIQIAREIERAYPDAASHARFACASS